MHEAIKILGIVVLLALAFIGISYLLTLPSKDDEATIIRDIVKCETENQKNKHAKLRGQHPKACGVVWAEFKVDPNIPDDLRFGVFKKPHDPNDSKDHFPAWIRFSKAIGEDDASKKGGVGMAIKLMAVPGKKILESEQSAGTQDFILLNSPVFFVRNIPDYISFLKKPILFLVSRWHEASIVIGFLGIKNKSLMERPYWSATPYQLGAYKVKYSAKPYADNKYETESQETLGKSLEKKLHTHDVYFDFCVQVQADSKKMPIEDPTIEWSEKESEFVKVATIRIPHQTFTSKEQQEFGENLSFTPWHSLPEHTPLGGINRVRKEVYLATAKARRSDNGDEPTPDTFKPNLDP